MLRFDHNKSGRCSKYCDELNCENEATLALRTATSCCCCCSLKDLAAFVQEVDTELAKPLNEGDYDALVNVIGILLRMKERQAATDEMFEPLKQAIELLKIYNQELPDEVYQHLQVGCIL